MGLKLNLKNPRDFVLAISGLFVSKKHLRGLTPKEIDVLGALMEHAKHGVITGSARKKVMDQLQIEPQNFYKIMTALKAKKAINGEELHQLFTTDEITLYHADSSSES